VALGARTRLRCLARACAVLRPCVCSGARGSIDAASHIAIWGRRIFDSPPDRRPDKNESRGRWTSSGANSSLIFLIPCGLHERLRRVDVDGLVALPSSPSLACGFPAARLQHDAIARPYSVAGPGCDWVTYVEIYPDDSVKRRVLFARSQCRRRDFGCKSSYRVRARGLWNSGLFFFSPLFDLFGHILLSKIVQNFMHYFWTMNKCSPSPRVPGLFPPPPSLFPSG